MTKAKYLQVLQILTNHPIYSLEHDYSLSLHNESFEEYERFTIELFSNNSYGSFHDGFARFFCEVASVVCVSLSFRSKHGVCICRFY